MNATKNNKVKLGAEMLEGREMMSVTSAVINSGVVTVWTDNNATAVTVNAGSTTGSVKIVEGGSGRNWSFYGVTRVDVAGGTGNDRFINNVSSIGMRAWGFGGNDYLEGANGADYLVGGEGNDTLVGYGGSDQLYGQGGNDILRGMDGNDFLYGEVGNDTLIGGADTDNLSGGDGDDTLVSIDGATTDTADGGNGRDTIWRDMVGTSKETATAEKLYNVASFANGADRTLDGDNIADPTDGTNYKNFRSNPLFADNGPSINDIDQNATNDCWILATLGAAVGDNSYVGREMVADFGDGTYGVRLGSSFYRVDADLPTTSTGALTNAGLGQQNSIWVAIVEKAYASYRTGVNTYASLNFGDSQDAFKAFNLGSVGGSYYAAGSNSATVANDLYNHWKSINNSCTVCTGTVPSGSPLVANHCYSVTYVARDSSGNVTSITVRNPWGPDNTSGNPYLTLTPAQLAACQVWLRWGISA
jgi:hypothetical protein